MIIVVRFGEESAAFLVEKVTGILKTESRAVESTPEVIPPDKAEFFRGLIRYQDRLITILNTERLLNVAEEFKTCA